MYTIGQRVKYRSTREAWIFHAASMGNQPAVMHLNARDEHGRIRPITGTIIHISTAGNDGTTYYDFSPDGWIVPPSGWPRGFQVSEKDISPAGEDEYLPGTLTDSTGRQLRTTDRYCPACHALLEEKSVYCDTCGTDIPKT